MSLTVKFGETQLRAVQAMLKDIKNGAPRAMTRALNRTLDTAVTRASREIRKDIRITHREVLEKIKKNRATFDRQQASLSAELRGLMLSRFSTQIKNITGPLPGDLRGKTVRVKVKPTGASKLMRGAFYVRLPNGVIAIAIPKDQASKKWRRKINVLHGPSISQVLKEELPNLSEQMAPVLEKNLDNEVNYLLLKHKGEI